VGDDWVGPDRDALFVRKAGISWEEVLTTDGSEGNLLTDIRNPYSTILKSPCNHPVRGIQYDLIAIQ
jgi:hypothetical protein